MTHRCEAERDGVRCAADAVAEVGPSNYGGQYWQACERHAEEAHMGGLGVDVERYDGEAM